MHGTVNIKFVRNKTVSYYTLCGTVGETLKNGTQCSLVDSSWDGGPFIRNVGIFLPHQQEAQPTDSCTSARTSDLTFYSNLFSLLFQRANIETKDMSVCEFASVWYQFV